MPPGLFRRNGRYSVRRVVPLDLQPSFGRREIVKALGTSDPRQARRLQPLIWSEFDKLFEERRAELRLGKPSVEPEADFNERVIRAVNRLRAQREKALEAGELEEWHRDMKFDLALDEEVLAGTFDPVHSLTSHEVGRSARKHVLNGDALPEPLQPKSGRPVELSTLIARWIDERQPVKKTRDKAQRVLDHFGIVAKTNDAAVVTPDTVQDFKEALQRTGRAPATNANELNLLRAMFSTAVKNRLLPSNPCDNINVTEVRNGSRAEKPRIAYDEAGLGTLFSSPVYAEGQRWVGGAGEAAYWLPIVGLFTGARLNEIGQLRTQDVVLETYLNEAGEQRQAWVIRIVEDKADGLKLKFASCARRVPVHRALVSLGFLDMVEAAKEEGRKRLFPHLKPDRYGTVTANYSKWFGRYLRTQCGITDSRLTFHSLRHTFKHYARQCLITKEVQDNLTGHGEKDTADRYGGLTYPLNPLVHAIEAFYVPNFRLPSKHPDPKQT